MFRKIEWFLINSWAFMLTKNTILKRKEKFHYLMNSKLSGIIWFLGKCLTGKKSRGQSVVWQCRSLCTTFFFLYWWKPQKSEIRLSKAILQKSKTLGDTFPPAALAESNLIFRYFKRYFTWVLILNIIPWI